MKLEVVLQENFGPSPNYKASQPSMGSDGRASRAARNASVRQDVTLPPLLILISISLLLYHSD
jgi:hypothetical protein